MFDARRKFKIYVKDTWAKYGAKVEPGGFPIFSVDTEDEAKRLVDRFPFGPTDTFRSYAERISNAYGEGVAAPSVEMNPVSAVDNQMSTANGQGASNPIAKAIMEASE